MGVDTHLETHLRVFVGLVYLFIHSLKICHPGGAE